MCLWHGTASLGTRAVVHDSASQDDASKLISVNLELGSGFVQRSHLTFGSPCALAPWPVACPLQLLGLAAGALMGIAALAPAANAGVVSTRSQLVH